MFEGNKRIDSFCINLKLDNHYTKLNIMILNKKFIFQTIKKPSVWAEGKRKEDWTSYLNTGGFFILFSSINIPIQSDISNIVLLPIFLIFNKLSLTLPS